MDSVAHQCKPNPLGPTRKEVVVVTNVGFLNNIKIEFVPIFKYIIYYYDNLKELMIKRLKEKIVNHTQHSDFIPISGKVIIAI